MPPRNWRLRIEGILQAIARIQRHVEGATFESFSSDEKTLDAVMRNIVVIGEAARHIPPEVEERYPHDSWHLSIIYSSMVPFSAPHFSTLGHCALLPSTRARSVTRRP